VAATAVGCLQSVPPPRVMDEKAAVTSSSANRLLKQRSWWEKLEGADCTGADVGIPQQQ